MIFYYSATGTPLGILPSRVYQGSHKANTVYFVCPIARSNVVNVCFLFCDGSTSPENVMNQVEDIDFIEMFDKDGKSFNVWEYDVPSTLTAIAGVVEVQFMIYDASGARLTTATSSFTVERGVNPDFIGELTTNMEIMTYLSVINSRKQDSAKVITQELEIATLLENEEYYLQEVSKLELDLTRFRLGTNALVSFDSGDTPTTLTISPIGAVFAGSDCEDGVFYPIANKHYEIMFNCTYYSETEVKIYARVNGWEI